MASTQKIYYHCRLLKAEWSTKKRLWALTFRSGHERRLVEARFVVFATVYYDHDKALPAIIPGIDRFSGLVVQPQFWPQDLKYTGKTIVIIRSGATAITLLLSLARKAARTTILQHSPSYIVSRRNHHSTYFSCLLPPSLRYKIRRLYWMVYTRLFFNLYKKLPSVAELILRRRALSELPERIPYNPHFKPAYNPWDQRICVCPNSDFYKALHGGAADIKTATIRNITATGIKLNTGEFLDADIIVTATGLKLQIAGGSDIIVDGSKVKFASKFIWRGSIMQDVPNAFFMIGYPNSSWTLGADMTCTIASRLLTYMQGHPIATVIPRVPDKLLIKPQSLITIASTYISRADGYMPIIGDRGSWKPRNNFFRDIVNAKYGSIITDLELIGHGSSYRHAGVIPMSTEADTTENPEIYGCSGALLGTDDSAFRLHPVAPASQYLFLRD